MNDPISSDSTPNKRRKLNDGSKGWDSDNDSGEEFTAEDFETAATLPLPQTQKRQLQYTRDQFHSDLNSRSSMTARASSPAHVTQPTQTLNGITQPTQLLPARNGVLVDRSSPTLSGLSSPPRQQPQPIRKAPFAKPSTSLIASAMRPQGTSFRPPVRPQWRSAPQAVNVESDDEPDPPIHYGSDEETQGLHSLKPTNFRKDGRGLDSTPNRSDRVKESPRAAGSVPGVFAGLMKEFEFNSSTTSKSDDMASAYGSTSRRFRPPQTMSRQTGPSRAQAVTATAYNTLEDIRDYAIRSKVFRIQEVYPHESVQRCFDALQKNSGNVEDAKSWLIEDEEQDAPGEDEDDRDELSSTTPVAKRGLAVAKSQQTDSSQPVRPAAKQEVKVNQTIAEKYASTARRQSQAAKVDEDESLEIKPRRRLLQKKNISRAPSPPSSPPPVQRMPQPLQRLTKQRPQQTVIVLDDDSDSESAVDPAQEEAEEVGMQESNFDRRLLKFFNECSVQDLADLSAHPEETIRFVLEARPFASLDSIRTISMAFETKSGKKGKPKPVGDKIVDVSSEMWTGYDAVDELVEQCESLAKPIKDALKSWGVASTSNGADGELQLMNMDEAHDSGIGTPTSSVADDNLTPRQPSSSKPKGRFLGQPESMNPETTLKDYQLVGLNWLNLLWTKRMSCILADDMGLGKTCQVISFLAHLQELKVDGVHLVIVPGSTLENWLREFKHFAPQLNVVPYYGSHIERPQLQAEIEANFDTIDVVVTTYDMAVKPDDNRFLRKQVSPMVCIYDEAHALRNPNSGRYNALARIPADFKVLLTGTPLQNNLQELVAILAFIMPELFAEKEEDLQYIFKHKASTKDDNHAALLSAQRIARARSMMTPFILRRKKAQVLDLPAKHSRVEYCDTTPTQARYYANLLGEAQAIFADRADGKKTKTRDSSNMLMALRMAAIHPLLSRRLYDDDKIDKIVQLLLKNPEFAGNEYEKTRAYLVGEHHQSFKGGDYGLHRFCSDRPYLSKFKLKKEDWMKGSGKIAAFRKLVTAFVANGDRILVFSQFTTMMDILEAVLETLRVKFMRLDGSTNMQIRQDMIDKFTNDESIPLFMLSTKAGGAGINLACANKVIIFDSGFNPQDDIQAENRAHRVGQTREVEVVRLVSRGTIEEQIHALGESKLALDERVAGEGASAAEDKQAEKAGQQMVEKLLVDKLNGKGEAEKKGLTKTESASGVDLKDAFKDGLEGAGLKVASKQAQF